MSRVVPWQLGTYARANELSYVCIAFQNTQCSGYVSANAVSNHILVILVYTSFLQLHG